MGPCRVYHQSVIVKDLVCGLAVCPGGTYFDCTIGDGDLATAILEAAPNGRLLGMDIDPGAMASSRLRLVNYGNATTVAQARFGALESVALAYRFVPAQGVLFDRGPSSRQLEAKEPGFSLQRAEPLDMRYCPDQCQTAADLVNGLGDGGETAHMHIGGVGSGSHLGLEPPTRQDQPGHPHLSGPAHSGQPGVRGPRPGARGAGTGWKAGGHQLPLPGGPVSQSATGTVTAGNPVASLILTLDPLSDQGGGTSNGRFQLL